MTYKIKNDDSFLRVPFKKDPCVIKTDWKNTGWGRREQLRFKVGPTGDLYVQTVLQGCFKRFINSAFGLVTCGKFNSFCKYVAKLQTLGHLNAIKVNLDLSRQQRAFLVARQQSNLKTSYVSLQEKILKELGDLSELQKQFTPQMLAYKELLEIIHHLKKMEEKVASEVSSLGDPQERFDRLCIFEAQLHFFAKAKEEKIKQWQSSLGKAIAADLESQKQALQHQVDELHEKLAQHLSFLMQKREECYIFPELYRQLSEMIVKTTEMQAHSVKKSYNEDLIGFKNQMDDLIQKNDQILVEIEQKKSLSESEAEVFRQKTFDEQIKAGKETLLRHIEKLQKVAEKYIPDSQPEQEIRRMIQQNRQILQEDPSHKEDQVNSFLRLIGTNIQNNNNDLKKILEFYSLPFFSPKKSHLVNLPSHVSSPLWLIEDLSGLSTNQKEASRGYENILEDCKHLITTMKAHSHEAREGGYLALEKKLLDMIIQFSQKNKEFKEFVQRYPNSQELSPKTTEISYELSSYLKQLADIHQIIIQQQTLEHLGSDVSTKIHQFARRLPGEIFSDEDVIKTQEKIDQLIKVDKSVLITSKEHLSDILQRQRQLISLCYSVAEKYIKMKRGILEKELNLSVQDPKIQFLHKARETIWKSLLQQGPACVTPDDLSQWAQKVFAQGIFDEVLIGVIKKHIENTLDEVKDIIIEIGKEGKREFPIPQKTDSSLMEYEKIISRFHDLESERSLSLSKMKKLLKKTDEKVQIWKQQELISHETAFRWGHISHSLEAKCACIDLLLEYDNLALAQYLIYLEERRVHFHQTKSSPCILEAFEKLFETIKPYAKWDYNAPIKSLDHFHALCTKTLEDVQKEFQILQSADEAQKAYAKVFKEAEQVIALCNQNNQFINAQKIQQLLDTQNQDLKLALEGSLNMLDYEKTLNSNREKLEDDIDLLKDLSPLDQLAALPEESSQAHLLRQVVVQDLSKQINSHQQELLHASDELHTLWQFSKSSWHEQFLEQIENKRKAIGNFLEILSSQKNNRGQLIELQSQIEQAISKDKLELENSTSLNKIIAAKKRFDPFISGIELKIADFRRDFQYSHAHRLNRIVQKEKEHCEALRKDLVSSAKMEGYSNAMEMAMVNIENILKHIQEIGPLSDLDQMKNLKSKNPEDFQQLHLHFRQGIENKIKDFHQNLDEYQKQTSAAIATLQCEININQQRKLKDSFGMAKLLNLSKKLNELEILQAKILEKNTFLQKLQEKFPVWTYAVWMGKHPLDVSQLSPDQLKEYETEVNEFMEKCHLELAPLLEVLKSVEISQ